MTGRPVSELTKPENAELMASMELITEAAVVRGRLEEINAYGKFLANRKREVEAKLRILSGRLARMKERNEDSKSSSS